MTKKITDFFALEGNYPDLDAEGAVARLSQAIQCRTINYADHSLTDYSEFDKLHAHMKASYPHVMRTGVFERHGHHAVLITLPGSDETLRPCLYMSHQDVVPVVEGTEQDWTYPAFSGAVADGYNLGPRHAGYQGAGLRRARGRGVSARPRQDLPAHGLPRLRRR